uniref:Uncharacterized protein LOC101508252 isoform X1 n=3 Tax=Cicer arietinum TaxID=3827 RepID=A0A3Q7YGB5_CICAR|nr:uncharacterized protein LOC101508252 isoform X1 [Cicer arietinum]XP_027191951.1 uncharacterized protein LOC101508252 isoform X1 [Cicer arietinum]
MQLPPIRIRVPYSGIFRAATRRPFLSTTSPTPTPTRFSLANSTSTTLRLSSSSPAFAVPFLHRQSSTYVSSDDDSDLDSASSQQQLGNSTLENVDAWRSKLNTLLRNKDEQEVVSNDKKDCRDFHQLEALANRMGLYSRQYAKGIVFSKAPLPNYHPDLDDKRPQQEVILPMLDVSLLRFNELDPSSKSTRVCNGLLMGLFKSGRTTDALHILDQMLELNSEFPPDDFTGEVVFGELVKRERPGKGLADEEIMGLVTKLGEHGVFPDTFKLTQLISKLCGKRKNCVAWELLHGVMKLGGPVEAASCNALLTGLGRERDIQKMNKLLAEMEELKIRPSVITFGILINHLCKARRIDEALGVFDKLRGKGEKNRNGVEPDVVLYNTLIDGLCKVGREEDGLSLLEEMKTEKKNRPNTVTYNCLIDGFCKAGNIDKARELFGLMNEEGVQPNVVTLNTLVGGMCKIGRVYSAVEFLNEMKGKGLKGNAVTYTALISAFCGVNNIDQAMQYFDEMLSSGCSPDAIVYYSLISGLSIAGRMDDASVVVSQLKRAGFGLDRTCYNVLISGFCKKKKLERVYEMLNQMEETGVKPDTVTYNTLVSYLGKAGDFAAASKVMEKMIKEGLKPSVVTYGAVIHAYCLKKNVDEAMKIFEEMCSTSIVPPNTVIYNILIDALCKINNVEKAVSLMDDMKVKGVRPNTTTYNAILKGVRDKRMLHKAFELMDRMVEDACSPDYVTMEILTEWLSAVGEIEKLKLFVEGYRVQNAVEYLKIIGALDENENLTVLGRKLSVLPVEPKLGKMLILGAIFDCLDPILTVVAGLSVRDPFVMPADKKGLAESVKAQFAARDYSDHLALVRAYDGWKDAEAQKAGYEYCWRNFLSSQTLRATESLRKQFFHLLKDIGLVGNNSETNNKWRNEVHMLRAVICAGLFPGISSVVNKEKSIALKTMEDGQVLLYANSVNAAVPKIPYPWLVFNEKVKVHTVFLRDSTAISDSMLLLFGGNISKGGLDGHLKMLGGYLEFFMKPELAKTYSTLKRELEELIQKKLLDPMFDSQSQNELLSAVRLLVFEDHCDGRFVYGPQIKATNSKSGVEVEGDNSKNQLQTFLNRARHGLPTYKTQQPKNNQFRSTVIFNGLDFVGQPCNSKKLAEKSAAAEAMLWLKGDSHSSGDIDHASVLLKKSNKNSRKKSFSGS